MKNKKTISKILLISLMSATIISPNIVFAARTSKSSSTTNTSYKGSTTISSSINESNKEYSSNTDGESAILVSGGESTLNSIVVNKTGNADGDNADFYGTNAGILAYNGTLNINGGTITTNGTHANAVFAYNKGIINISNATINTSSNNSGGIMVTGGGTINARNLTVETQGGSSAAIRSDRGGGTIIVNGGSYTSNGSGSPAIYSTADITVNNAKLVSNVASGVVIEGDNSVTLNSVDLYNSNTKSNTKGEEANYKNIFIYQSTSGDAEEGTGTFTAKDSKITTTNGSTIFVTNTTAVITLENNEIINTDKKGLFLKSSSARWGKEGSNGGTVILNMINQYVDGDIVLDSISTLDLSMTKGSVLVGAINSDNTAKNINLKLSSDSVLSLTADTYINSLDNELSDNSNIYSNGKYKLYVDGKEVSINSGTYNGEKPTVDVELTTNENNPTENNNVKESNNVIYYIVGGCAVIIALTSGIILIIKKRKNR